MRTDLVTGAPAFAERSRGSLAGTVLRTDHGAQHTSRAFPMPAAGRASASP